MRLQLGGTPPKIAEAEQQRMRAITDRDEEALLQANAVLLAAMLDCQFGNVTLNKKTSEIQIEACLSTTPSQQIHHLLLIASVSFNHSETPFLVSFGNSL